MGVTASLFSLLACTPTDSVVHIPPISAAPAPAGEQAPGPPPADPPRANPVDPGPSSSEFDNTEIVQLVRDLSVIYSGGELGCLSAQCFAFAEWANFDCESEDGRWAPKTVQMVGPEGLREVIVDREEELSGARVLPKGGQSVSERLYLAATDSRIASTVRLEDRWLEPVQDDGPKIEAWVRKRAGPDLVLAGEIRGEFGGGVDRIVVFGLQARPTCEDSEEAWATSEVAVLVSGHDPQGMLPWTSEPVEPGRGVFGLQVAGVFDIDADGTQEVLWVNQPLHCADLVTSLTVSYYAAGAHHLREVFGCTYVGDNSFIPLEHCRGTTKRG